MHELNRTDTKTEIIIQINEFNIWLSKEKKKEQRDGNYI